MARGAAQPRAARARRLKIEGIQATLTLACLSLPFNAPISHDQRSLALNPAGHSGKAQEGDEYVASQLACPARPHPGA